MYVGGLIRDSKGKVLFCYSGPGGKGNALQVEALSLFIGLAKVAQPNISVNEIEGDNSFSIYS